MKRVLSLVLALVMVLGMIPMGFAADQTAGEVLKGYGLVAGYPDGSLGENLKINRAEMMVQLARLNGKFEEAKTFNPALTTFTDLEGFAWAAPYIAYAEINEWTAGVGGGKFNPAGEVTLQEAAVFMLKSLGYVADTDFNWANAVEVATAKGLVAGVTATGTAAVTRGQLFTVMLNTLNTNLKDGSMTLGAKLGVFKVLAIKSAKVTNVDEITVEFSIPVVNGVTVQLMNGLVPYTTTNTWNEAKTTVVMKSPFALPAATYTVKVTDLEPVEVKVEAEKATSVTIENSGFEKKAAAPITLKLLNQYGKEMTLVRNQFTITAFNATKGQTVTVADDAFTMNLSGADINDQVVVSAVYNNMGISLAATKTAPVIAEFAASQFNFTRVVMPKDQTKIYVSNSDVEIEYTLVDQFGKAMKLPAGTGSQIGGVAFVSTNNNIVNPSNFTTDADGKLFFDAGTTKGTVVITAVVIATGKASTISIEVVEKETVNKFTISAPAALVVAKENVVVPYVALDQFGAPILPKNVVVDLNVTPGTTAPDLTFMSSNVDVIKATDFSLNAKGELVLNATAKGSAIVYVYVNGVLQNSVTFNVLEEAKPARVTGLKNAVTMFEAGDTPGSKEFKIDNITVVDQYNRAYTVASEEITVVAKDGTFTNVAKVGTNITATNSVTLKGATVGSESIEFAIKDVAGSAFVVTMGTVASNSITSYEVTAAGTVLANKTGLSWTENHIKEVELTGKTSNGAVVALIPGKVTQATSSNLAVATVTVNADGSGALITGVAKGTSEISLWNGATKLATTTVTVSEDKPVTTSVSFEEEVVTVVGTYEVIAKDQYGVVMTAVGNYYSSDVNVVTVGLTSGTIAKVAAGDATITFVSSNGLVATYKVSF